MALEHRERETVHRQEVYSDVAPVTDAATVERTDMVATDPYAPRRDAADRVVQGIYLVFGVLEGLLAIRFILKLLGASEAAGFTSFIYNVTAPLLAPFAGMFGTPQSDGSVLEIHTIVAIVVYALVAWLLAKLAWLVIGETRSAVQTTTRSVDTHMR